MLPFKSQKFKYCRLLFLNPPIYRFLTGFNQKFICLFKVTATEKVTETKKDGVKYYTKKHFRPLYAGDVDFNTMQMEEAIGNGYILTREVFGLNEKTRPYAEQWIKWANKNPDKVDSIFTAEIEEERE